MTPEEAINNFETIRHFISIKSERYTKKTYVDYEKKLDLDIYGDICAAKKIVILLHTIAENSDSKMNRFLSNSFFDDGFVVVFVNEPGFRNIVTSKPTFPTELSVQRHREMIVTCVEMIRQFNDCPIVFSSFSAGGFLAISTILSEKMENIAGAVLLDSIFYSEKLSNDRKLLHYFTAPYVFSIYFKNFVLTSQFRKAAKLLRNPLSYNNLYLSNEEKFHVLPTTNKYDIPIICFHHKTDPVVDIEDGRRFAKSVDKNFHFVELGFDAAIGHSLTSYEANLLVKYANKLCKNEKIDL